MLIGHAIFVVERDDDRYGRLVGALYALGGVNVILEMVCDGSVWWCSRYAKNKKRLLAVRMKPRKLGKIVG